MSRLVSWLVFAALSLLCCCGQQRATAAGEEPAPRPDTPRTGALKMMKSRTVTVSIARPPSEVSAFVSDPDNLAKWLTFVTSVRRSGDEATVDTPDGPMVFRFVPRNELGVLDHHVRLPSGEGVLNPMRVVPNGEGSEVIFTLFQRADMTDQAFAQDAGTVETDLRKLKSVLEK